MQCDDATAHVASGGLEKSWTDHDGAEAAVAAVAGMLVAAVADAEQLHVAGGLDSGRGAERDVQGETAPVIPVPSGVACLFSWMEP